MVILTIQFKMDSIIDDRPSKMISKPTIVVQEKVIYKKVYVYTDKFGIDHEGDDRIAVQREVREVNERPFQMKDSAGETWQHQDKATLIDWIKRRNNWLAQPAIPVSQALPASPILQMPTSHLLQNCGPVG